MARASTYKEEFAQKAKELCEIFGATDAELCEMLKVSKATLNRWKIKYPGFKAAMQAGKDIYDCNNVEVSLRKRAMGYESVEETLERNKDGKMVVTKQVKKQVAPDTTACIYWTKNRNPLRWRDTQKIDLGGRVQIILEDDKD